MGGQLAGGAGFSTFERQDRVLVALSGGVDSAVCVRILQQQGFDVHGLVIRFSPAHAHAVEAARTAAGQLGIPLEVASCEDLFEQAVVTPFCESYCSGITPSPCVFCNPLVKFRVLADTADRMGIHYIATGHYARIDGREDIYYVRQAVSAARDQSYMLYRLGQDILCRLCLPVGEFEKPDIRQMAREMGLACADAPDSQEICFIPEGDYTAFIAARGLPDKAGRFIGPAGEDLGPHKGVSHYTVGQRRGLGIPYGEPVFVQRILENGDIRLARAGEEFAAGVTLGRTVRTAHGPWPEGMRCAVKIRSRAPLAGCTVRCRADGRLDVLFDEPLRAPAPGQSAVLYAGDLVIGGGVIESTAPDSD